MSTTEPQTDRQQIIYALERAERQLNAEADRLAKVHDYSAEFSSEDANRMREAITILQRQVQQQSVERDAAQWIKERDRMHALINTPELDGFLRGVHIEAVHQVERWGEAGDRAKRPADWFWLVGYLAGKALHAAIGGNRDKARHHCISTAAALYNWHCGISGIDVRMCPGRSDLAAAVDRTFPGEAAG